MGKRYILDGEIPVEEPDIFAWSRWFENGPNRRVALDHIGDVTISTVFLAIDHNWTEKGKPILWETMIFGGSRDGDAERYSSYRDAVAGHDRIKMEIINEKKVT